MSVVLKHVLCLEGGMAMLLNLMIDNNQNDQHDIFLHSTAKSAIGSAPQTVIINSKVEQHKGCPTQYDSMMVRTSGFKMSQCPSGCAPRWRSMRWKSAQSDGFPVMRAAAPSILNKGRVET